MYIFEEEPTFWWEVKIKVPDGKRHITKSLMIQFKTLSPEEVGQILKDRAEEKDDDGVSRQSIELDLMKRVVQGWKDIVGVDKQPVDFTEERLEQFLRVPYQRRGMVESFYDAINGGARKGN